MQLLHREHRIAAVGHLLVTRFVPHIHSRWTPNTVIEEDAKMTVLEIEIQTFTRGSLISWLRSGSLFSYTATLWMECSRPTLRH